MENFTYANKTEIIFGKGTEDSVGKEVKKYGNKVLFHYGGGSIKRTGLYDTVIDSLKQEGLEVIELGGVQPNPKLNLVKEGIETCFTEGIDFILAVGGGSVIDSAKAIGIGAKYKGDVWDLYTDKATPKEMIPVGVVLTIPAAGSETSGGSVITKEDEQLKKVAFSECMRPEFAILNPELNYTLPPYQTSCGICDMLAHVMERYFTKVDNVELTDRLCEATMKTIIHNAYKILKDPKDYNSRAEILWSGTIAHNDLLGTGRTGDWASHGMEHEISALTDLAHGAGLSIIFPAWMKYVCRSNVKKFIQFANRVFNIKQNNEPDIDIALLGIEALEKFFKDLKLPIRLNEIEFDSDLIDTMVNKITNNKKDTIGSFMELNSDDIKKIYELAI